LISLFVCFQKRGSLFFQILGEIEHKNSEKICALTMSLVIDKIIVPSMFSKKIKK
jgi:hypothetical protein